ncbi:hypothetical protein BJX99DRAFT_222741 [Aspergillus californicus]
MHHRPNALFSRHLDSTRLCWCILCWYVDPGSPGSCSLWQFGVSLGQLLPKPRHTPQQKQQKGCCGSVTSRRYSKKT